MYISEAQKFITQKIHKLTKIFQNIYIFFNINMYMYINPQENVESQSQL